jgi:hypothetical protein
MTIAEKIRKIIAKAESTTSSEEAAIFMEKAHRLMEEHSISLLDLGRLDADDPVGIDLYFYESKKSTPWRETLAGTLAQYYGCRLVTESTYKNGKVEEIWHSIAGRQSARITYQLMWPFVLKQVMKIANEDYKNGYYNNPPQAYRQTALALAVRINKLNKERQNEADQSSNKLAQVNALVPIDMIEDLIDLYFPNSRTTGAKNVSINSHALQRANEVSLNRQTSGSASSLRIGHD